ncbi:MAG: prolyl oligopeptidase family serine peptidase [Acidobacteriota bacterium]|nr:prolyl oligopeptidase family serine peptidase [Acidobacteriota bacterium]
MTLFFRTAAVAVGALLAFQAQPAGKFALTIDNIMRGPGLVGYEPAQIRWSGDGERIYFEWKQASDPENKDMDTYVVNRDGTGLRKLTEQEEKTAPPAVGDTTRDRRLTTYARNGDIFIYDGSNGQTRQITQTADIESNPHFTRDGKRLYFTRANNLYVMSLENGSVVEMTDIRAAGAAGSAAPPSGPPLGQGRGGGQNRQAVVTGDEPPKGTESQEFLKKQERDLLEVVRQRAAKREADEAKRKRENPRKPFTLQARQSVAGLQLSPDEKYVIASIREAGDREKTTIVPNFVTESSYTEDIPSRDKVGDVQPRTRIALLNVGSGEVKWVDTGLKKTPPVGAVKTESGKEIGEDAKDAAKPPTAAERDLQLLQPVWSEDGTKAVLVARSADNKDRWILALDPVTGKTRVLVDQHDDAWVDGPGAFTVGWLKGDREVYFQSEKSGYSQLYAVGYDGGEPRALTSGKFEVSAAVLSKDKSHFYLTTSEVGPEERQVYVMDANGGARTRLTTAPGNHAAVLSPDEHWMADLYSYTNKPPELYVQEAKAGAPAKKLTSSPAPEFWQYSWLDTPIVKFAARDGVTLHARLYKPANFKGGGPGVVFVHGAGYLQNVHRWWSTYYHEYMFHHLLMEHGYEVIDVDYRGSAGYGRDWRTAIYEHMGGKDLDDNVDAAKWLVTHEGIDPKRIGLYGGSYGGFITLMALFTEPDVFAAGAALRPVTDWAHYNHGYTANILNVPQSDPEAYRKSSPIYFASGLKGALLICHGMVDTNVHFQDTVRLVQKLIELRKENWQLAVYPVENHGFVEPTSWADEYKRIFALFEKNLKASRAGYSTSIATNEAAARE